MKVKVFKQFGLYTRLWLKVVSVCTRKLAVDRFEGLSRLSRGVFLLIVQIIYIKAIVGDSGEYMGYSTDEMILLIGFFNLVGYISWAVFSVNLGRVEEKVITGQFDQILFKPISSIFGASIMEFFIDDFLTIISGLLLVGWFFVKHFSEITVAGYIFSLIALIVGVCLWFSIDLIIAATDFIAVKTGLRALKERINGVGRFPIDSWNPYMQIFFTIIFPTVFMAAVPASMVLNPDWKLLLFGVILCIVFLWISKNFWYWALRRYNSVG